MFLFYLISTYAFNLEGVIGLPILVQEIHISFFYWPKAWVTNLTLPPQIRGDFLLTFTAFLTITSNVSSHTFNQTKLFPLKYSAKPSLQVILFLYWPENSYWWYRFYSDQAILCFFIVVVFVDSLDKRGKIPF